VRSVGGIFGESTYSKKVDAFSEKVARVDEALDSGAPLPEELGEDAAARAEELEAMRVHLQVRRLTRTGPMTHEDVTEASAIFKEFNPQIAGQKLEGSRQALRSERTRRLLEAMPRLDGAAIERELTKLREQIAAATKKL
jgi:hypothetical protein